MGGFWSDISKTSTGTKRSALDQARMQLLQQLLAAELNASAFGSVPTGGTGQFAVWEAAFCGTNQSAIKSAQQRAASFNTNGDSGTFTPGTSADSKGARAIANYAFWDKPCGAVTRTSEQDVQTGARQRRAPSFPARSRRPVSSAPLLRAGNLGSSRAVDRLGLEPPERGPGIRDHRDERCATGGSRGALGARPGHQVVDRAGLKNDLQGVDRCRDVLGEVPQRTGRIRAVLSGSERPTRCVEIPGNGSPVSWCVAVTRGSVLRRGPSAEPF